MSKITSDQLLENIRKSQLVEADQTDALEVRLRQTHSGGLPEDPVELALAFQKSELLTRWQCEKLLSGKYKGFFLGNHKLLGHIGTGGMSTVYLAEHQVLKHKRAIKVLPKAKLGNSSHLARFQREAKAIASLSHPNVVKAYDINNEGNTHYIVLEYVEGSDLQVLVKKQGPLPFDQAADYIAQAARGLQHAHELGLIHRDVKPANLLVNPQGVVKVLDLGLALFTEDLDAGLTAEFNDKVLGTADYLAPEQALNSHLVDVRADIYGLGGSLYFLLTGHPPFPDGTIAQRIAKHQKVMPDDIRKSRPDCPGELDGICVKMLQKDPKYRYPDCKTVAEVLEAWRVKYRESLKVKVGAGGAGGSSSSLQLHQELPKPGDASETVSAKSQDTASGKSSTSDDPYHLARSDSAILRSVAQREASASLSSALDLENDLVRRSLSGSNALSKGSSASSAASKPSTGSHATKGAASATSPVASKSQTPSPSPQPATPGKSTSLWLILLLAFLFVLAVALGIVIGRYSAVSQSPSSPQSIGAPVFCHNDLEASADRLSDWC
jgi:serine/threonine-protein kinase